MFRQVAAPRHEQLDLMLAADETGEGFAQHDSPAGGVFALQDRRDFAQRFPAPVRESHAAAGPGGLEAYVHPLRRVGLAPGMPAETQAVATLVDLDRSP